MTEPQQELCGFILGHVHRWVPLARLGSRLLRERSLKLSRGGIISRKRRLLNIHSFVHSFKQPVFVRHLESRLAFCARITMLEACKKLRAGNADLVRNDLVYCQR
jgi:hypothetical protein